MNPTGTNSAGRQLAISHFLAIHIALLSIVSCWGAYRLQSLRAERQLPQLREKPLRVEPLYDYDVVVSDEQLGRVLMKLRPRFLGDKTKINHVDHALRFWGTAEFADDSLISGAQMHLLLTDNDRFAEVYGDDRPPLLIDKNLGIAVRVQEGDATSSHVDHTLACLAEVGTRLNYPITTPTRRLAYRAMIEQSLRDFSLNQIEYEWSGMTYAMFLPPATHWYTTEGQEMSFDRLAERIMRETLDNGVCFANHRIYTLVVFLRVDEQVPILAKATRQEIKAFLKEVTGLLVQHQHADGFWTGDWPHGAATSSAATEEVGDRLPDRILATGHALEWWAIAPEELHPPRAVLASSGQWLVRTIDAMTDEEIQSSYTYLTHAGRALALWRSRKPATALQPSSATTPPVAAADVPPPVTGDDPQPVRDGNRTAEETTVRP